MQMLPRVVPSPHAPGEASREFWRSRGAAELQGFGDAAHLGEVVDRTEVERALAEHPAAFGDASAEQLAWALSIVRSRVFGTAGEGGAMGMFLLAPLVDLLNHAGEEADGLLSGPAVQCDNVR